ncbi:DUF1236 domain-containing protein [Mesorhizobium sp. NZP2077]|uniref:DUF1236 domain-containing protein n=1 Tax=Mesorhizobium sp. NZP2077 TaxID=2483404 RepID=UPI0015516D74|nr:DUF1236 domain-containing protein [Mesorhizobium sp. NZP2077]QKC82747.1 DUF1236 domain-containing protein [Mesorhizobium sp. NZP2077]QKD16244.1 DUF1236 domain-containing protein [Mesorhizobium sp. NZP2077]
MKYYLSSAAAAIILMGGIGAALAEDVVVVQPAQRIVVQPEQETVVRQYIKKQPLASVNLLGLELKLGSPVPDKVELREVPNVKYRVAVINDQTVLVDPETRQIVEVLN